MADEYIQILRRIEQALNRSENSSDRVERHLHRIEMTLGDKMADLARLAREVEENNEVVQSAIDLITNLAQEIRDTAGNEQAANELADQLDAQSGRLAEAVALNTPAEPPSN